MKKIIKDPSLPPRPKRSKDKGYTWDYEYPQHGARISWKRKRRDGGFLIFKYVFFKNLGWRIWYPKKYRKHGIVTTEDIKKAGIVPCDDYLLIGYW